MSTASRRTSRRCVLVLPRRALHDGASPHTFCTRRSQLSRTSVPLSTFESLSSSLSSTLTPLQRQLRRQTLETQHAQLSSTERLSALAGAVDELCLAFAAQDQELVALRDVVAARSALATVHKRSPALSNAAAVLGSVIKHLVVYLATPAYAHGRGDERERERARHGVAWYALWPVRVPRALVGWAVKGTAKGAVKALGWEGDAEAAAAASSSATGAGGAGALGKGRNHKRIESAPSGVAALGGGASGKGKEEEEAYSDDDADSDEDDLDLKPDLERAPPSARASPYAAASYAPLAQPARYARPQQQQQQQVPVPAAGRRPGAGLRSTSSRSQHQQRVVGAA